VGEEDEGSAVKSQGCKKDKAIARFAFPATINKHMRRREREEPIKRLVAGASKSCYGASCFLINLS
jgi:hypothetical protein